MGVCNPIPQRHCGRFSRPSLCLRTWAADSWPPPDCQRTSPPLMRCSRAGKNAPPYPGDEALTNANVRRVPCCVPLPFHQLFTHHLLADSEESRATLHFFASTAIAAAEISLFTPRRCRSRNCFTRWSRSSLRNPCPPLVISISKCETPTFFIASSSSSA